MRVALIVGISRYEHGGSLFGCVDDAHAVNAALDRYGDGTVDFDTGTDLIDRVKCSFSKDHVADFFEEAEMRQPWMWYTLEKARWDHK